MLSECASIWERIFIINRDIADLFIDADEKEFIGFKISDGGTDIYFSGISNDSSDSENQLKRRGKMLLPKTSESGKLFNSPFKLCLLFQWLVLPLMLLLTLKKFITSFSSTFRQKNYKSYSRRK